MSGLGLIVNVSMGMQMKKTRRRSFFWACASRAWNSFTKNYKNEKSRGEIVREISSTI